MITWSVANALYRRETYDNYPAQRAIMSCVYEGLQLPMDRALKVESRYFTWLLRQPEARAMTRSLFLSMQALGKGARRPASVPPSKVRKLGILGAGMMGAGIAYVSARAGMEVVLLDRDVASADKGKAYSVGLVEKAVTRGQASEADGRALLDRIRPTDDYADLDGCDLVIEAVFEDRAIKADVTRTAEARLSGAAVFGSNTSTLPITGLAEASGRPDRFIGIHFFSPVDKMMLVELILGEQTGDEALALALDYVRAIRKTPIVVNDARGFYTSRVVSTYIDEGITMLADGIPAAMVENVGRMAGMPVGPLALNDEVSLDLARKIQLAARADLGAAYVETPRDRILEEMVDRRGRLGRKNAKGFYDYPEGAKKRLWPGLADVAPATADPDAIDTADLEARFLVRQALETARCFEEGVVTDVREADVGAILGWGFAPFTGGPLSYIDAMGLGEFLRLCERFEQDHGPRFAPCALIRDLAASGDSFYTRFAPAGGRQAAA
jgi:3-hydroxyacyl-CoA dehydrogenase/enoyl-CoA hydratase/3-hydroxybutyryl-CoA epimerase